MPGPIDLSSCQASPESSPGLETFGSIERREVSVAWPGALCWHRVRDSGSTRRRVLDDDLDGDDEEDAFFEWNMIEKGKF